jgi:hypothetical protein
MLISSHELFKVFRETVDTSDAPLVVEKPT